MITANELALAGIVGTLLGAIVGGGLTYLAQRRSTRESIEAERALSRDERLWQQRVSVYGQVLTSMDRTAGPAVQLRPIIATGEIDDGSAGEFVRHAGRRGHSPCVARAAMGLAMKPPWHPSTVAVRTGRLMSAN